VRDDVVCYYRWSLPVVRRVTSFCSTGDLGMRVTQRTPDVLVIEEGAGTPIFFISICLGVGAISVIIGWTNEKWLFVIVGTVFALFGLKIFLFNRTRTHRFERWRGMLAIDSKGLLGSDRRELPLDRIADVVIEELRSRAARVIISTT
jgi:hypothetical protein